MPITGAIISQTCHGAAGGLQARPNLSGQRRSREWHLDGLCGGGLILVSTGARLLLCFHLCAGNSSGTGHPGFMRLVEASQIPGVVV